MIRVDTENQFVCKSGPHLSVPWEISAFLDYECYDTLINTKLVSIEKRMQTKCSIYTNAADAVLKWDYLNLWIKDIPIIPASLVIINCVKGFVYS